MKPTQRLHELGQSLWLDNITRDLLSSGTLKRYIDDLGITGLTSNPTIFDHAFRTRGAYDDAIRSAADGGRLPEDVFFALAIEDLRAAAELFARGDRPNLFIKIPGTEQGLPAIEEATSAGVPVNVTLLLSAEHYLAAADAYMRGLQRRVEAGLDPAVGSVASLFVSRWDSAPESTGQPAELHGRLGIAQAKRAYRAYRELLESTRWQRLANEGARPQRLLWASTGTKDPHASDILYVRALTAPLMVNTMPEKTLLAFADHGDVTEFLPADGGDGDEVIARFAASGVDLDALAARLQSEGAEKFVASWDELIATISRKTQTLTAAG